MYELLENNFLCFFSLCLKGESVKYFLDSLDRIGQPVNPIDFKIEQYTVVEEDNVYELKMFLYAYDLLFW